MGSLCTIDLYQLPNAQIRNTAQPNVMGHGYSCQRKTSPNVLHLVWSDRAVTKVIM